MRLTDKQQRTLVSLALTSLKVVNWNVMGKHCGLAIRNEFETIKYPMRVQQWNAYMPPSFDFSFKDFTPEVKIRKFILAHFNAIRKMVTKNEWIKCDDVINLNEKESIALFNLSGIGSHYVIVDLPPQADPYISCYQLIDAAEKKVLKRFKSMVEAEAISNIGKKNTHKLFNVDPEKRTICISNVKQPK